MKNVLINELMQFLDKSLTSYHAIYELKKELVESEYCEMKETHKWEFEEGKNFFCIRNDSSLIAFRLPECNVEDIKGFHVYAAHSDSPAFKIKENPSITKEGVYVTVNTEKYGGMIMNTWLDRPLTIAGRVCVQKNGEIISHVVKLKDNICMIPNLAIHMNREINNGVSLNPQTDMMPLLMMECEGINGRTVINDLLAKVLSQDTGEEYCTEDILAADIFVENSQKSVIAGANDEFIMSARYDDLACAYAGFRAFLDANASDRYINVFAVFDNEEVGSLTRQGADSTFFRDTLENICEGLGVSAGTMRRWIANSFMISADNAHACHPNQSGKADPVNKPYLNNGIVLKYHGGQKYSTDAYSAAYVKMICKENDIPLQIYTNRSDIAGGSTLGNIIMSQVSMPAADIGLAQLAMHSAYETAGVKDVEYLCIFVSRYFERKYEDVE